jgi:hemerythrin-like domain-containing protein
LLDLRAEPLQTAVSILREFIANYHEKDEEELIFPRLEKAGRQVELIGVLRRQHEVGRKLLTQIERYCTPAQFGTVANRRSLAGLLAQFNRMYRPHAAREDTVLYPAFRELVGEKELDKLQVVFEQREKALPHGGFEKVVGEVARIEVAYGLADLAQFTAKA